MRRPSGRSSTDPNQRDIWDLIFLDLGFDLDPWSFGLTDPNQRDICDLKIESHFKIIQMEISPNHDANNTQSSSNHDANNTQSSPNHDANNTQSSLNHDANNTQSSPDVESTGTESILLEDDIELSDYIYTECILCGDILPEFCFYSHCTDCRISLRN